MNGISKLCSTFNIYITEFYLKVVEELFYSADRVVIYIEVVRIGEQISLKSVLVSLCGYS